MERIKLSALLFAFLLVGCVSQTKVASSSPSDAATVQLAEAATSISQSLVNLSAIELANTPPSAYKRLVKVGHTLPGTVSVDWSGPVEPLLKRIATLSNYRLRVLGVRPAIPVIVTVNAKDILLSDLVRNVDFQCDKKARVFIYPRGHILELRYLG